MTTSKSESAEEEINYLLHISCCTVERHQFHLRSDFVQNHDPLDILTSVTSPGDMALLKHMFPFTTEMQGIHNITINSDIIQNHIT